MTTLADIAKAAGVSPAVVSRVINNDGSLRIGKETRVRVLKIIDELNYAPNIAARSLRSARSGTIAVVVHEVSNPVYSEIIKGAQEAAARFGKSILLGDASANPMSSSRLADMIGGGGVDGLVMQADGGIAEKVLINAARQNVPTVLLQAELDIPAHLICLPDEEGARIATEHLMGLGHHEIGCLATTKGLTFTRNREKGWRAARRRKNQRSPKDLVEYCGPTIEEGLLGTLNLLKRNPEVTAIVCFNVMAAIGALEAAKEARLKVPRDLSIIAIHDIKLADFLRTPLTTVAMPLFELGQRAIELVSDERGYDDGVSVIQDTAPELIIRKSTAPPKTPAAS